MTRQDPAVQRALASVRRIAELRPIENADRIELARIDGWGVVVGKGDFQVGDLCVYMEIDTLLDSTNPAFARFATRGEKTCPTTGRRGHVLTTARLRGIYSQGLAMRIDEFPQLAGRNVEIGDDLTAELDVVKYEEPLPSELADIAVGWRPSSVPSTDVIRGQNVTSVFGLPGRWIATEKIDGTSTSFFIDSEQRAGTSSRNVQLAEGNCREWRAAANLGIHARIASTWPGRQVAVQGELFGAGAPRNPLRLTTSEFRAFNLVVDGSEIPRDQWPDWLEAVGAPIHPLPWPADINEALEQVEKLDSLIAPGRLAEGVVWRIADRTSIQLGDGQLIRAAVKVISRRYLLKHS